MSDEQYPQQYGQVPQNPGQPMPQANPNIPVGGQPQPQGWQNTGWQQQPQPQGWENTGWQQQPQPQGWENTGWQQQPQPQGWENTGWQGQYPGQMLVPKPSTPNPVNEFLAGAFDFNQSKKLGAGFGKIYQLSVLVGSALLWIMAVIVSFKAAFPKDLDASPSLAILAVLILLTGWIFVITNAARARMTVAMAMEAQEAKQARKDAEAETEDQA